MNLIDPQKYLDELYAKYPEATEYLRSAPIYLPDDMTLPVGMTHTVVVANREGQTLTVALSVRPMYARLVDAILGAF